jgi:hypothetical protein
MGVTSLIELSDIVLALVSILTAIRRLKKLNNLGS